MEQGSKLSRESVALLSRLIHQSILPALPSFVQEALAPVPIVIRFVSETGYAADGLFVAREGRKPGEPLEIRLRAKLASGPNAKQLLTHEFFHAIHFILNPYEEDWVREGLAQQFEQLVLGYANGVNIAAAFREISTPLSGGFDANRVVAAQYGHVSLYFHYLVSQCGGAELFWSLAKLPSRDPGASSIDDRLRASPGAALGKIQCSSFEASARAFEIARVHNRRLYESADSGPEAQIQIDPKVYHLLSSALQGPEPRRSFTASEAELLPRHTPVLLGPEVELSEEQLQKVERVWIERRFPYSVRLERPVGSESVQLILKR